MVAAAVSLTIMGVVLVRYGLSQDNEPKQLAPSPRSKPALSPSTMLGSADPGQPHEGAEHHTADKPEHQGGMASPIQVFAKANAGDWQSYKVTTESSLAQTFTAVGILRITAADDKQVSREFSGRVDQTGEVKKQSYEARPRAGLTLDQLTTNDVGGWTIYDVVVSDDVHEVAGRKFKCKKISYASNDPMFPNKRAHTDLWISEQVPGDGFVEEIEVQDLPNMHFRISKQVVGFGDAKTTLWGEKPAGL